jgi:DNA-binding NarL/FixJ family response regulator
MERRCTMMVSDELVRIVLVDANVLFRCGIARILDSQPDFRVVGEAEDVGTAMGLAMKYYPAILLLDSAQGDEDGPRFIRQVKQELPAVSVVVLAAGIDPDHLLACTLAGAAGYLQKNITPDELFARLRGLVRGEAAMALTTVATLIRRLSVGNCTLCLSAVSNPNLTSRESEVLSLVARGLSNKLIGAELRISEHTVRNHLCSIYQKLNLKNRLQVAVYSVTHGLVDLASVM